MNKSITKVAKGIVKDVILKSVLPFSNVKRYPRICNVCEYEGFFEPSGVRELKIDTLCPNCLSLPRHRFLKLCIDQTGTISKDDSILHFAPEQCMTNFLRPVAARYVTSDLYSGKVDLVLDIERMELPDESYSRVVCSHVLEHVDDGRALTEIFRILTRPGLALLMVPLIEGWETTYENPAIESEDERELHFNQRDHVRYFGRDFRDRVAAAGFALTEYSATPVECVTYSLTRGEKVFMAAKP